MAIEITQGLVNATFTGYNTAFNVAFATAQRDTWYQRVCTELNVAGEVLKLPFVIDAGTMREWVGERVVTALESSDYSIANKPYEKTLGINLRKVEDDMLGLYGPAIANHAQSAAKNPDKITYELLATGESATCLDGRPFFAANHPVNPASRAGGTYSNLLASSALTHANLEVALKTMRKIKHPNGKDPLGIRPKVLLVGPDLQATAEKILNRGQVAENNAAVDNLNKGRVELVVADELADLDDGASWFLIDDTKPLKPLLFWMRQSIRVVTRTRLDDPSVFDRGELLFGCDGRQGVGFGMPQCMLKAKTS